MGILPRLFIHVFAYIVTNKCILLLFCSPNNIQRFTYTTIENGTLLPFQQLFVNIDVNNLPISGWKCIAEPWLTHIIMSEVRRMLSKKKRQTHCAVLLAFLKINTCIKLVGIGYFCGLMTVAYAVLFKRMP